MHHHPLHTAFPRCLSAQPGVAGTGGALAAVPMVKALAGSTPLVLDSPHSGTHYPADFGAACDLAMLRRAEDTHVEKIYSFAPALGAAWIEAYFPRIYLDVNRDLTELDTALLDGPWAGPLATNPDALAKVRLGKGLLWKLTDDGVPVYDRLLSAAEVQGRIDRCWQPYHRALQQAIEAAHARHGFSIHLNCHSMPAVAGSHATLHPGMEHADFVIGDRDGSSASPIVSLLICEHLRGCGYSVAHNHPYKGVELVRRHSDPDRQRHSVQIEINRKLYMDEQTLALNHSGFARLRMDLQALVQMLLGHDPR